MSAAVTKDAAEPERGPAMTADGALVRPDAGTARGTAGDVPHGELPPSGSNAAALPASKASAPHGKRGRARHGHGRRRQPGSSETAAPANPSGPRIAAQANDPGGPTGSAGLPRQGVILARFPHPEPPRAPRRMVLPVFLPFAGCPGRCVFCDQRAQTGQTPEPLPAIHERLGRRLAELPPAPLSESEGPAPELAFYGGTFTALPAPWPRRFLELARPFVESGRLSRVRCSTRPDAVNAHGLAELRGLGLSLVELGVQSFNDAALAASRRGYTGATARAACDMVRAAGLSLGVQLMPGMPGLNAGAFRQDVAAAAALAPELTRLYPCLVLEGTELAAMWRAGEFTPWPLADAIDALADALPVLWRAGVRVARIGLAEQAGLAVLAGPRHPALGQMTRSGALLRIVAQALRELPGPADTLLLPRRLQGEALGQKHALAAEYAALGLTVRLWDGPDIALCVRTGENAPDDGPAAGPRGAGLCSAPEIC